MLCERRQEDFTKNYSQGGKEPSDKELFSGLLDPLEFFLYFPRNAGQISPISCHF